MSSKPEFADGADQAGGRLAEIVRRLVDARIRSTAGEDELAAAAEHVEAAMTVLHDRPGSAVLKHSGGGLTRAAWPQLRAGNMGVPLSVWSERDAASNP